MAWFAQTVRRLFGSSPVHEAAGRGRRALAWMPGNPGAVATMLATSTELRIKSRDLVRRNAWAQAAIEAFVANAVGTSIKPQSLSDDEAFKTDVQALWRDWVEEADAASQTDFYGLQSLACRAMLEGGECLIRLRPRRAEDGLAVPMQLQLLEPEHLPISLNTDLPNGNVVRSGIEFDSLGRRVAYHLYRSHPEDGRLAPMSGQGGMDTVRIDAREIIHLYRVLRPGQIRGEPWLSRALVKLNELDQYDDAELVRKKTAAMFAGFVTRANPEDNQSLDAEAKAHQTAAQAATSARNEIAQTLAQTQTKIDEISAKLSEGLNVTLNADTTRFDQALSDLDKALAEKEYLLQIQADLQEAENKLKEYEQLLKEGKTLPVDADVSKAQAALDKLKTYADQNAQFELKVATEKAQAAITNVERQITALDRLQTESRHIVSSNADQARAEIQSLNGMNTSSTHTIYVQRVEVNATGGLVGGVRRFADGGAVTPSFPRLSGGTVPGSGHHDSVPRALDAGAFVIRKAAVRKYGAGRLAALSRGIARFALGGPVTPAEKPKRNRDVVETLKMIDLGLQGMNEYTSWLQWNYGASVSLNMKSDTMRNYGKQADADRKALGPMLATKTLTANERAIVERAKQTWRSAMAQLLLWGKDLERELIDYMESQDGQFLARGGLAKSDTVPAMLTPGEFVVNRNAVARLGAGFFEAINNLSAPAQALAGRAMASIQGFASGGLVQPIGANVTRPALNDANAPARTVRVELASGGSKVDAFIDARDETRLLQLLDAARARTA